MSPKKFSKDTIQKASSAIDLGFAVVARYSRPVAHGKTSVPVLQLFTGVGAETSTYDINPNWFPEIDVGERMALVDIIQCVQ